MSAPPGSATITELPEAGDRRAVGHGQVEPYERCAHEYPPGLHPRARVARSTLSDPGAGGELIGRCQTRALLCAG